ncbi:TRUB2 synthase, partial [Polypterus senegalus]
MKSIVHTRCQEQVLIGRMPLESPDASFHTRVSHWLLHRAGVPKKNVLIVTRNRKHRGHSGQVTVSPFITATFQEGLPPRGKDVLAEYIVQGVFGKATDDFSDTGRLVEKTTFDHVTLCSLEKIIAMIDGTHRKALLTYAGIDLHSQEAYEQAVAGLLRPSHKTTPLITGIRCVHFDPPHFTLEVQSLNETQQYLRKVVHEIGLELRSSAVCGQVRRTRDGPFTQHDALLHSHWDLDKVRAAVAEAGPRVWAALRCARDVQPGERRESVRATNTESAEHT